MIPKAIFTLINLICITICAHIAVDGFYDSLSARLVQRPAVVRQNVYQVNDTQTASRPMSAYNAVLERNLFGTRSKAEAKPTTEKVDVESLEETTLNLKLWGTVFGDEETEYAVIEDVKARQQNLYRTGDSVQTATVKKIFREKVVLTVDGKDEILQMEDLVSGKSGFRPSGPTARTATSPEAIRAQRISLRRSYIEQAMQDMATLMTQVQIRPHMEEGVAAGLALSRIKPNSIFRRMGLRNGDIITGVDGREISTVNDALGLVDNLQSASKVSVQLKRRGREKNIEYSIR